VALARRLVPRPAFADTGTGGMFKVPSLRNIELTRPYMHDGRFANLDAVLDHYAHPARDALARERLDPRLRPLLLLSGEKHDLIDFLNSLTDLQSNSGVSGGLVITGASTSTSTSTSDNALH
jgi:cytochrome c peroxidase